MLNPADTLLRHQLQNIIKNGINDNVLITMVIMSSQTLGYLTWLPQIITRASITGFA
jgi:hypothetical protein